MKFFFTFFAETETIWSQGPVTQDFWKSYLIRSRYSTLKHFRACSAWDEISSAYAQHAIKLVPRMLSMRWNSFRVCWAHFDDSEMGRDFPLYWAYSEIGYSLAEHMRKLVTRWLSIRGNWLLVGWPYAEIRILLRVFNSYCTIFHPLYQFLSEVGKATS